MSTHTYVTLAVSAAAFDEIKAKLEAAGYGDTFLTDGVNLKLPMQGIALTSAAGRRFAIRSPGDASFGCGRCQDLMCEDCASMSGEFAYLIEARTVALERAIAELVRLRREAELLRRENESLRRYGPKR